MRSFFTAVIVGGEEEVHIFSIFFCGQLEDIDESIRRYGF